MVPEIKRILYATDLTKNSAYAFFYAADLGSVAGSVLERSRKPVFVIPLPSEKTNIDWDKF